MEVLTNHCYGGFGVSNKAQQLYASKKGFTLEEVRDEWGTVNLYKDGKFFYPDWDRDDPILIEVFNELGSAEFSATFAEVELTEIPNGISWEIDEYDGMERVVESHRSW